MRGYCCGMLVVSILRLMTLGRRLPRDGRVSCLALLGFCSSTGHRSWVSCAMGARELSERFDTTRDNAPVYLPTWRSSEELTRRLRDECVVLAAVTAWSSTVAHLYAHCAVDCVLVNTCNRCVNCRVWCFRSRYVDETYLSRTT